MMASVDTSISSTPSSIAPAARTEWQLPPATPDTASSGPAAAWRHQVGCATSGQAHGDGSQGNPDDQRARLQCEPSTAPAAQRHHLDDEHARGAPKTKAAAAYRPSSAERLGSTAAVAPDAADRGLPATLAPLREMWTFSAQRAWCRHRGRDAPAASKRSKILLSRSFIKGREVLGVLVLPGPPENRLSPVNRCVMPPSGTTA